MIQFICISPMPWVSLKTKYLADFQIQLASAQVESKSRTEQQSWQTFSHKGEFGQPANICNGFNTHISAFELISAFEIIPESPTLFTHSFLIRLKMFNLSTLVVSRTRGRCGGSRTF